MQDSQKNKPLYAAISSPIIAPQKSLVNSNTLVRQFIHRSPLYAKKSLGSNQHQQLHWKRLLFRFHPLPDAHLAINVILSLSPDNRVHRRGFSAQGREKCSEE